MPADASSSHDAIILRPNLSNWHEESKNCYQALAAKREVGHGASFFLKTQVFLFSTEMFMESPIGDRNIIDIKLRITSKSYLIIELIGHISVRYMCIYPSV